jgi:hypothetical protein
MQQAMLSGKLRRAFERCVELDPKNLDGLIGLTRYFSNAPEIAGGSLVKARRVRAAGGRGPPLSGCGRARTDRGKRETTRGSPSGTMRRPASSTPSTPACSPPAGDCSPNSAARTRRGSASPPRSRSNPGTPGPAKGWTNWIARRQHLRRRPEAGWTGQPLGRPTRPGHENSGLNIHVAARGPTTQSVAEERRLTAGRVRERSVRCLLGVCTSTFRLSLRGSRRKSHLAVLRPDLRFGPAYRSQFLHCRHFFMTRHPATPAPSFVVPARAGAIRLAACLLALVTPGPRPSPHLRRHRSGPAAGGAGRRGGQGRGIRRRADALRRRGRRRPRLPVDLDAGRHAPADGAPRRRRRHLGRQRSSSSPTPRRRMPGPARLHDRHRGRRHGRQLLRRRHGQRLLQRRGRPGQPQAVHPRARPERRRPHARLLFDRHRYGFLQYRAGRHLPRRQRHPLRPGQPRRHHQQPAEGPNLRKPTASPSCRTSAATAPTARCSTSTR